MQPDLAQAVLPARVAFPALRIVADWRRSPSTSCVLSASDKTAEEYADLAYGFCLSRNHNELRP